MIGLPPSPFLSDIQSSPAPYSGSLNSGESDLQVTADCGAGEARFVLDDERAGIIADILALPPIELDDLPAFLTAPRDEYLGMIERGVDERTC